MSWSVTCSCGYVAKDNQFPSDCFFWLLKDITDIEEKVRVFICPECAKAMYELWPSEKRNVE